MSFRPLKWVGNATLMAQPISTVEWNRHRDHITELHRDGKTRKEIGEIMARDFDFKPSAHQYTSQFEKWNLRRYNTAKDSTPPRANNSAADVPQTSGTTNQEEVDLNTRELDAIPDRQGFTSKLHGSEEGLGRQHPFSDPYKSEAILDQPVPMFSAGTSIIMTPTTTRDLPLGGQTRETPGVGGRLLEAEDLQATGDETPRVSP
jgi:hypothetical protein